MKKYLLLIFLLFICGCTENAYLKDYYMPKEGRVMSENSLSGKILWHGNRMLPEVALTFDDGPNSKATPQILDILKSHDIKVTFFVLGKFVERNKGIVKREALEGHSIGNHTYTHASGGITDINKIKRELARTDALIEKYSSKKPAYFRPPFGYENWRFLSEAELLDYKGILWSLDVGDWNQKTTEKEYINKILKLTKNGTIILLHDGGTSREAVINTLPKIITSLKKKGFKFVTIDEMVSHL